jgi:hypothetical protein
MKLTTSMAFSPWDRITDLKTLCSREEFENDIELPVHMG